MKLRLATRASQLALWQANTTAARLESAWSDLEVELEKVTSSGDKDRETALERFGRIGIFTVEVDRALSDGRAEVSVHSLKDMTTTLEEGLVLASVLPRGPVEDVLVSRDGAGFDALPGGARVATGSMRRAAMVRAARPDLEVVGLRGNVETRLAKLAAGEAEAILLARAGLVRLGLEEKITEVLSTRVFLPAVGQGIVGLVVREGDAESRRRVEAIGDLEAWDEALAERAFLRALRGGCNVPAAGHARAVEESLVLAGRVLAVGGERVVAGEVRGPRTEAESLGEELAKELLAQGADELLEAARG